jgi:CRISPR-associated endoribonuclease Cas6/Csy4 subtype I-F
MTPNFYLDIEVVGADDSGLSLPSLRSLAFMKLHSRFKKSPGVFAIAIPRLSKGKGLRVFATTQEEVESLLAGLAEEVWFRDYARVRGVKAVPQDYSGGWAAFARYRIPTVKSDRHATGDTSSLRDRRLAYARDKRLEYFNVRSSSTSQSFSLTVERLDGVGLPREGVPNSYGLCSRLAPLGLPDFE